MENSTKEIGKKLKTARSAKNLTQNELAGLVGMNVTSYARVERGEVSVTLDNFLKILEVLDLKFDQLIK